MAPGVHTIQPNGEANYAIAIRGVASSDFTTNVESPVALYVDEVYVSQMSGAGFMLFDMERVEILRGPRAPCSAAMPRVAWCTTLPANRPPSSTAT